MDRYYERNGIEAGWERPTNSVSRAYDNPFEDYLPEPPAFTGRPKSVVTQLSQQQIDKAMELGITPECAHQLLNSLRKLFQVPVVLDGKRQYPLIAFYFLTNGRIPVRIQAMSVQISDVDKYRIVQAPYKKVIDYLASLPNANHDPVCMQPYFD